MGIPRHTVRLQAPRHWLRAEARLAGAVWGDPANAEPPRARRSPTQLYKQVCPPLTHRPATSRTCLFLSLHKPNTFRSLVIKSALLPAALHLPLNPPYVTTAPSNAKPQTPRSTGPAMSRTWNTDSTSSTRSAEKFGLDDKDNSSILVYKYRTGLDLSSQEDLCKALDKGTSHQASPQFENTDTHRFAPFKRSHPARHSQAHSARRQQSRSEARRPLERRGEEHLLGLS